MPKQDNFSDTTIIFDSTAKDGQTTHYAIPKLQCLQDLIRDGMQPYQPNDVWPPVDEVFRRTLNANRSCMRAKCHVGRRKIRHRICMINVGRHSTIRKLSAECNPSPGLGRGNMPPRNRHPLTKGSDIHKNLIKMMQRLELNCSLRNH